ncbi:MAG: hypothetical protein IKZ86_15330 [Spirochaetaceae bacterium]|nr:hypothetical protein [Spirochaetaceae bacterium]
MEDDSRFCSKCGKQLVEEINVVTNNNSNSKKTEKTIDTVDTVESYTERAYPLVEDAIARFNASTAVFNMNLNDDTNLEIANRAGLNLIEVYLDYYKGKVKIQRQGDYSEMNTFMEEVIALVERNYIANNVFLSLRSQEQFEKKLSELRSEWRKIRQL